MNPLQQASFRRKIYYLGTILLLFTLSMFWRGILSIPLSSTARAAEARSSVQQAADKLNNANILNQARALDLRELEQGEPELTGEFVRLALSGSRGIAVTWLWYSLMDQQKRNDFHKMEQTIRSVTWLQPHFITPWIFQSWNISYNVSVEMQGSGDMYHYIARGIDLLAEGERRNTHTYQDRKIGSPDMRYQIAFYYHNKFGVSDQVEVLRCLFQLSCISPDERNPKDFIDKQTGEINLARFQEFCQKNPHLVRRLRGEDMEAAKSDELTKKKVQEALKCPRPEDIVQFLKENEEILTRYSHGKELAEAEKQFPALPPKFKDSEAHPGSSSDIINDDFSAYLAARAWYMYSLEPVPPAILDIYDEPLPSGLPRPATQEGVVRSGEYDPFLYRIPRQPMLIIFRQGAPRVQSSQAEMEQKEGWFDSDGWRIDDPSEQPQKWWFPDSEAKGVTRPLNLVVGTENAWSLDAWKIAANRWLEHGNKNGLIISKQRLQRYEENGIGATGRMPNDPSEIEMMDRAQRAKYEARLALFYYPQNRNVTNFSFFLASAQAEAQTDTVVARKVLWQAEQARKLGLVRFMLTDQILADLKTGNVPEAVSAKISHLKNKVFNRESLATEIIEVLEKDNLARFKLTDKTIANLRDSRVPESVLSKLAPVKDKDYSQEEFTREIDKALNTDELERFKKVISSQCNEVMKHVELILNRCRMTPAQLYEEGLKKWKGVLAKYPEFHRPERSERTEEDTFGFELAYLRLLVQDDERVRAKANEVAHRISNVLRLSATVLPFQPYSFTASVPYWSTGSTGFIGTAIAQSLASPFAVPEWKKEALEDIKWHVAETQFSPFAGLMRAEDGVVDPERLGGPWIRPEVKRAVLTTQGMTKAPSKPNPPNSTGAPPQPLPKKE